MRRIGKLEVISFITGFSLLTYELAAARVLAPAIGSSTYVWTSVIGVIIASLALGFFVGGKLADRRDHQTDLVWLLCLAGLMVLATMTLYSGVLEAVPWWSGDVRLQGVFAALVLFAPTSFVIGMTSPYLAKLNVRSLKTTGQHIASLDALNSLGGIIGTFLTGFVLFGYVGSHQTFALVALLLVAVSWLVAPRYRWRERGVFSAICLVVIGLLSQTPSGSIVNIDTPTAHYQIRPYERHGQPVRGLITDPMGIQSAVYTSGSSAPVFWYNQELARLTLAAKPERVLVMGGGAFTLPQYLAEQLPNAQIDVVEIDPVLKDISEQYFHYKNPSNVRLVFNDARAFLNQTDHQYDVVVADVYGNSMIPFQLMTREYVQTLDKHVRPGGRVIANVIGGSYGPCRLVLEALHGAYSEAFRHASYAIEPGADEARTNFIVQYSRQPIADPGLARLQLSGGPVYSDNFAPAERLYYACEQA